jgi:prepilin-type N-terminal cleavage/methylation domain-containing protein
LSKNPVAPNDSFSKLYLRTFHRESSLSASIVKSHKHERKFRGVKMMNVKQNQIEPKKAMLKSNAGFSLLELMVALSIAAIITMIAIPGFYQYQAKARSSEAKSQLVALFIAEKQFEAEWNSYSTDAMAIGFRPTGKLRYVIGFNTPSANTPPGYTGPAIVPDNVSTGVAGLCPNLGCINAAVTPAGVAITAVTLATTAAMTTFSAAAEGFVGGPQTDIWSIDQNRTLTNPQPGGY